MVRNIAINYDNDNDAAFFKMINYLTYTQVYFTDALCKNVSVFYLFFCNSLIG